MFPLKKIHTEQIFVVVGIQLLSHVDTQTLKRFKLYNMAMRYVLNLECCKCAGMRFLCANSLVVLHV